MLDVEYDGYQQVNNDCLYPTYLFAEGQGISGSVQIGIDKVYNTPLADEIFHLQLPDHFTLIEVE